MSKQQYILFLIITFASIFGVRAYGFSPDVYTDTSALASGRWVKIAVDEDGLYRIPQSRLRSWGIDPSKAVIRGYGGRRQNVVLSKENYTDDLPVVQSVMTDAGLVFYGLGAGAWTKTNEVNRFWYEQNDYDTSGYYFVGEVSSDSDRREIETVESNVSLDGTPATRFYERLQHERELVPCPGEAGPILLGEDFKYSRRQTFSFDLPGLDATGSVWMRVSFVSNNSATGSLNFKVNGTTLDSNSYDRVPAKSSSSYTYAVQTETVHTFNVDREKINVELEFSGGGTVEGAWLNYMTINYPRHLEIGRNEKLVFSTATLHNRLKASGNGLHLWDVSDADNIVSIKPEPYGQDAVQWAYKSTTSNARTYAAWYDSSVLGEPRTVGVVANQNLHSHSDYDMVIVTPPAYAEQAERIANFHRNSTDSLRVVLVNPDEIYNEFSSGTRDVGGIRRYFKMLYDRGLNGGQRRLRYAILFGRTTQDNRGLTSVSVSYPTIPSWMPAGVRASLSDNSGYCTDDVTAMLDDNSGRSLGASYLSIAIGRLPVTSVVEARDVVDKLMEYAERSKKSAWKHRFLFLADDQDQGSHLLQTERLLGQYEKEGGDRIMAKKVYMDAYTFVGDRYPEARNAMFRALDEGVVWWNYIGHANTSGWSHEHQLSYSDINSMYLRHRPFIYAATCDFLRLDGTMISGGEVMFKERNGGAIGMLSAVRPVYISDNGNLSGAMGRALAQTSSDGRMLPPGEICRRAKNDIRNSKDTDRISDENRLRYSFVGDPALPLALPSNNIVVDSIKGISLADEDAQPTLAALERATVTGYVTLPDGTIMSDFNGTLSVDIFDAERTITTNGRGEGGTVENFESYGDRIYCGAAKVKDGRFRLNVSMPMEISQNFRPAAMSLYAFSDTDNREAIGFNTAFYVYGYDESAEADTTAPEIETMVLNHEDFKDGDAVNVNSMLIATLRDDVGINVSTAGIGHQLTAILDGRTTFTGLSDFYTPSSDGSPSGVLNYPMEDLAAGNHTLELRVWDTSGNSASKSIEFTVAEGLAPKIYDVYTDANPASTSANFYLRHNQPDNNLSVTISIYNYVGRPVWSGSSNGRSDMFLTVPVSWDLTDMSGRRVPRGIYLYRASVTADGVHYETASKRIAVTAQ